MGWTIYQLVQDFATIHSIWCGSHLVKFPGADENLHVCWWLGRAENAHFFECTSHRHGAKARRYVGVSDWVGGSGADKVPWCLLFMKWHSCCYADHCLGGGWGGAMRMFLIVRSWCFMLMKRHAGCYAVHSSWYMSWYFCCYASHGSCTWSDMRVDTLSFFLKPGLITLLAAFAEYCKDRKKTDRTSTSWHVRPGQRQCLAALKVKKRVITVSSNKLSSSLIVLT